MSRNEEFSKPETAKPAKESNSSKRPQSDMWKCGDGMEPSAAAIRESNERIARGPQRGITTLPVETIEPPAP